MGPRKKKETNAAGSQAPEAAALQVLISQSSFKTIVLKSLTVFIKLLCYHICRTSKNECEIYHAALGHRHREQEPPHHQEGGDRLGFHQSVARVGV